MQWDFEHKNFPSPAGTVTKKKKVFEMRIPEGMPFRKVYCYMEAKLSTDGDYKLKGKLDFIFKGKSAGHLPMSLGSDNAGNNLTEPLLNACGNSQEPSGEDSLFVVLPQKFTSGPRSAWLHPCYVNKAAEYVQFHIEEVEPYGGITIQQLKILTIICSNEEPFR